MPKKILLADDSITIQKVVELTFSDGDYEVTAVNNGAKAVQKLAEMRPDIILSDIIMPEKNGYEVCEYVKSHPEFRNIPVVLLTGTFEPFDPDRAEKAGCDAVVTKPFESQSLIHKVEELIAQSKANSNAAPPAPAPEPLSTQAVAPVEAASPWMDETPAAPESFTHDNDIFAAAPPIQATTEMPFEIPPTPSFSNDSSFASAADTPFGEPAGEAFGGETRAFPRMTFEEMQQMAANATPPPPPAPEPSPWQAPAPVTFDDFAPPPPPAAAAPEPEPENDSPFGAPPPIEEFSSETRAFPRMSLEEMQQMTSGGISVDQPSVAPPPPPPAPEPPAAASPWDEQETPAFSGETRAFPKMNFDDFQQQSPASDASPFGTDDAPAFGGETRAFPKLSFDDFQQMSATPAESQPEPQAEAPSAWDPQPEPQATAPSAWDPQPEPQAEEPSTLVWDAPAAAEEPADAFAESAAPFNAAEASTAYNTPEPSYDAPSFDAPAAAEVPSSFTDQPMAEDVPFAAEPVESLSAEEPVWSLPEGGAEAAEAEAEPEEPASAATAPAALAPEAPPMPIAARSADLTDEQVDRIARRVVELISDQVVRNIAWEVIPDLAEMVVKERIRQLEAEA